MITTTTITIGIVADAFRRGGRRAAPISFSSCKTAAPRAPPTRKRAWNCSGVRDVRRFRLRYVQLFHRTGA
jgi:hypothetical protein